MTKFSLSRAMPIRRVSTPLTDSTPQLSKFDVKIKLPKSTRCRHQVDDAAIKLTDIGSDAVMNLIINVNQQPISISYIIPGRPAKAPARRPGEVCVEYDIDVQSENIIEHGIDDHDAPDTA